MILLALFAIIEVKATDYDCRVVQLVDDSFFDTALQEYGNGDEDYANVSLKTMEGVTTMKVGGLNYPNRTNKIVSLEKNAKNWVKVVSGEETEFSFLLDHTNGKAYLVEGEDSSKAIAYLNCFYQDGINPFEDKDYRF